MPKLRVINKGHLHDHRWVVSGGSWHRSEINRYVSTEWMLEFIASEKNGARVHTVFIDPTCSHPPKKTHVNVCTNNSEGVFENRYVVAFNSYLDARDFAVKATKLMDTEVPWFDYVGEFLEDDGDGVDPSAIFECHNFRGALSDLDPDILVVANSGSLGEIPAYPENVEWVFARWTEGTEGFIIRHTGSWPLFVSRFHKLDFF